MAQRISVEMHGAVRVAAIGGSVLLIVLLIHVVLQVTCRGLSLHGEDALNLVRTVIAMQELSVALEISAKLDRVNAGVLCS